MSETFPPIGDDDSVLAAEYVLGLLDDREREILEDRIATDAEFSQVVETWENHFAELAMVLPDAAPSPDVWHRIHEELFPAPVRRRRPWWHSLAIWQAAAASFAAVALVLGVALFLRPGPQPQPQTPAPSEIYVAALSAADQPATVIVRIDADERLIVIPPFEVETGGQVTELWLIAESQDPYSLGLINPDGNTRLALDETSMARLAETSALAISLEPQGGSPTGLPTGPVIALGQLTTL